MIGQETDWLVVGHIDLLFGKVAVVDSSYAAGQCVGSMHRISSGRYQAKVKVMEYGRDRHVSRFRLCSHEEGTALGRKVGEIGIDSARAVIWDAPFAGDYRSRKPSLLKDVQAAQERLWVPPKRNLCSVGKIARTRGSKLIVVETGFGDGSFPIHEIRGGGKRVGLELVFIEPGQPYPFEVRSAPALDEEAKAEEALHWSLIESCWDDAWSALRLGSDATRKFFEQLTPGRRAMLAIDLFSKEVLLMGGIHPFFSGWSKDVLADEVLAGFRLLGAEEYSRRFEQVHLLCRPVAEIKDLNAQNKAAMALFHGPSGESLYGFDDWFREAMRDRERRIGPFIRAYTNLHPEDFRA